MNLTQAVLLVWHDVADSVLRHPTIDEVLAYARDTITTEELANVLEHQRAGGYADPDGVCGDVYGAYVAVRAADEAAVAAVADAERWRGE